MCGMAALKINASLSAKDDPQPQLPPAFGLPTTCWKYKQHIRQLKDFLLQPSSPSSCHNQPDEGKLASKVDLMSSSAKSTVAPRTN